jgi:hypothetical protein
VAALKLDIGYLSAVPDENWVEGVGLGEGLSPVESKCEKSVDFGASKAQPNQ